MNIVHKSRVIIVHTNDSSQYVRVGPSLGTPFTTLVLATPLSCRWKRSACGRYPGGPQ